MASSMSAKAAVSRAAFLPAQRAVQQRRGSLQVRAARRGRQTTGQPAISRRPASRQGGRGGRALRPSSKEWQQF